MFASTATDVVDMLSGPSLGSATAVVYLQVLAPIALLRYGVAWVVRAFR